MTYAITDFDRGDMNQYFGDTWVDYLTRKGNKRVGRITSFTAQDVVLADRRGNMHTVPLSAILWNGLAPARCIAYNSQLVFVSASGARVYKKPPTDRNTMALIFHDVDSAPVLQGAGGQRSMRNGISADLIVAYLEDQEDYPTTVQEALTLLQHGARAIPLSAREGVLYCPIRERLLHAKDGALVQVYSDYHQIGTIMENMKHGN